MPSPRPVTVRIPASTSNLGAGFDCLGMALEVWLEASITPGAGAADYAGQMAGIDPRDDLVRRPLVEAGLAGGLDLTVRSEIPVARGLGSSAAAAVAGHVLLALTRGERPDPDAVFEAVAATEGHPDNAAPAVYGGAVLSVGDDRGAARPIPVPVHPDIGVALAVPDQPVETARARAVLPAAVARATAVAQAARSAALVTGLRTGDGLAIAEGMIDGIAVPCRRSLIEGFDAARSAGVEAGAYGVTISGSGSTLLALAPGAAAAGVARAMAVALTGCGNRAVPLTPGISQTGFRVAGVP